MARCLYRDKAAGDEGLNFVHGPPTILTNNGDRFTRIALEFLGLLKRTLHGMLPASLSNRPVTLTEQINSFNNRKDGYCKITAGGTFASAMAGLARRRLTYSDLSYKDESPRASDINGNSGSSLFLCRGFSICVHCSF